MAFWLRVGVFRYRVALAMIRAAAAHCNVRGNLPLFLGLEDNQLEELAESMVKERYTAGQVQSGAMADWRQRQMITER